MNGQPILSATAEYEMAAYDALPLACWVVDRDTLVVAQNRTAKLHIGSVELGVRAAALCSDGDRLDGWLRSGAGEPLRADLNSRLGALPMVLYQQTAALAERGSILIVAVPFNELALFSEELAIYRSAYRGSGQATAVTGADGALTSANPAFVALFGGATDKLLGKPLEALLPAPMAREYRAMLVELARESGTVSRRLVARRSPDASERREFPCQWQSLPTGDGGYLHFITDITEQVAAEQTLRAAANSDPLSGVMNRTGFNQAFSHAFSEAQRKGEPLAIAYIDLDRFKYVNDHYGHDCGDHLLKCAAERLQACVKRSDIVARLGGDEFAVIMRGEVPVAVTEGIALKIVQALGRPYSLGGINHRCTCSVGLASYPGDAMDMSGLLKAADSAMYVAKANGSNQFRFHNREVQLHQAQRQQKIREIELALEHHRMVPWYQPIVDLRSGQVVGLEALARRINSDGEAECPETFIGLIEQSDAMLRFGLEIARQVAQQVELLLVADIDLPVSINFSSYQMRSPRTRDYLVDLAERAPEIAARIKLEITETLLIDNDNTVVEHLQALAAHGYRLVLDDFGTGHSSISTLRALHFDGVKIDKSFIADIPAQGAVQPTNLLLNALLKLVQAVGGEIVCEGVEQPHQAAYLLEQGCRFGQGYLYAEPMPRGEIGRYLASQQNRRAIAAADNGSRQ